MPHPSIPLSPAQIEAMAAAFPSPSDPPEPEPTAPPVRLVPPATTRDALATIFGEGGPPSLSPCAKCGEPSLLRLCGDCAEPDAPPGPRYPPPIFPPYFDRVTVDDPAWLCAHAHPIPTRHWSNAVECAHALAESKGSVVLLIGPAGSGKTVVGIAAARIVERSAQRPRERPLWVTAKDLERARAVHPLGMGEAPIVTRAKRAGLVVIDDLGTDEVTAASAVVDVIMHRFNAALRTWVTTGLDADSTPGTFPKIAKKYGDGVKRRLTERAHARVVRFGGVA